MGHPLILCRVGARKLEQLEGQLRELVPETDQAFRQWQPLRARWNKGELDPDAVLQLIFLAEGKPQWCLNLAAVLADCGQLAYRLVWQVLQSTLEMVEGDDSPLLDLGQWTELAVRIGYWPEEAEQRQAFLRRMLHAPQVQPTPKMREFLEQLPLNPLTATAWWMVDRRRLEQAWPPNGAPQELFFELLGAFHPERVQLPEKRREELHQWVGNLWKQRRPFQMNWISNSRHALHVLYAARVVHLEPKLLIKLLKRFGLWGLAVELLNDGLEPDCSLRHEQVVQAVLEHWNCPPQKLTVALQSWAGEADYPLLKRTIARCVKNAAGRHSLQRKDSLQVELLAALLQHPKWCCPPAELEQSSKRRPPQPQHPWLVVVAPPRIAACTLVRSQGEPIPPKQLQSILPWLQLGPVVESAVALFCPACPQPLPPGQSLSHWLPQQEQLAAISLPLRMAPALLGLEQTGGGAK